LMPSAEDKRDGLKVLTGSVEDKREETTETGKLQDVLNVTTKEKLVS